MSFSKFVSFKGHQWRQFFQKNRFGGKIGLLRSLREMCPEYRRISTRFDGLLKMCALNGSSMALRQLFEKKLFWR